MKVGKGAKVSSSNRSLKQRRWFVCWVEVYCNVQSFSD